MEDLWTLRALPAHPTGTPGSVDVGTQSISDMKEVADRETISCRCNLKTTFACPFVGSPPPTTPGFDWISCLTFCYIILNSDHHYFQKQIFESVLRLISWAESIAKAPKLRMLCLYFLDSSGCFMSVVGAFFWRIYFKHWNTHQEHLHGALCSAPLRQMQPWNSSDLERPSMFSIIR